MKCKCGCGKEVKGFNYKKHKAIEFLHGHNKAHLNNNLKDPNPSGICMCGCGQPVKRNHRLKRFHNKYIKGHEHKGKTLTAQHKEKLKGRSGSKNPAWKGGITPITKLIRKSLKYKEWIQKVFIRDDFTCQDCGKRGCALEAHHKKPFSKLLEEAKKYLPLLDLFEAAMLYTPLWDISNGKTLCNKCHGKTKRGIKT